MFNWFKNKPLPKETPSTLVEFVNEVMGPGALAVAIAKCVAGYTRDVQNGVVTYPSYKREKASVVEVWRDTRLEALHKLFNFGKSDTYLLSDFVEQPRLLNCLLDEKVYLQWPQPY